METVKSADGTTIAFQRSGQGPPLVIVVGAFCDHASSNHLTALLRSSYSVLEYDRRGRGDSGDTAPYAIEREVEDLDAVVGASGGKAFVYGHSSGGAIALEAAARGVAIRRVAVWEPPYAGADHPGDAGASELAELVRSGHRAEAAERFLAYTGAPPEVVESIKAGPGWPRMQAIAHTLPYDLILCREGRVPLDLLGRIPVPALALAGGWSAEWAPAAARAIAEAAPQGESRVVEGQHHAPADEVLVPMLRDFFV
ncbi:MAG: hypothetical protein QOJ07_408 [Thermoleophilaceae bacterium]|nr:hypothetical protein [Thermoleophilaceae bacterium]